MKYLHKYIIQFEEVHKTSTDLGGYEININPMYDQPKWINRVGKVIEIPLAIQTPIKKGYEVLVVHTVLLEEILPKQGHVENIFMIDSGKNLFEFDDNLIVMYRESSNDKWKCHLNSIMVEPIKASEKDKDINGLTLPDSVFENELGYKGNMLQKGVIAYDNKTLNKMGIYNGDTVTFKKDREYEFELDGKTYWHMESNDVIMYEPKFSKDKKELSDAFC